MLLGGHRGDRGAAIRTVTLWYVVGVFCGGVGAVVDVFLGGLRGGAVAVGAVRLRMVVVVAV